MFINDYVPEEWNKVFDCTDGQHTVVVGAARVCNSKSGKQMIEIAYRVDNIREWYIDRVVEGEYFNKNITKIFDAFGIKRGDFDFNNWKKKSAQAVFEHHQEEFTGSDGIVHTSNKAVLKYFVTGASQLAAQTMAANGMQPASQMTQPVAQEELPVTQMVNKDGFVEDIPF